MYSRDLLGDKDATRQDNMKLLVEISDRRQSSMTCILSTAIRDDI